MKRYDVEARLSDVVAAAQGGGEVEVVRDGTVVARVSPTNRAEVPRRWEPEDLEKLKLVHEAARPLHIRDGALLVREVRDEGH